MTEVAYSLAARYDIGRFLGKGGFGEVRDAISKQEAEVRAVKIFLRLNLSTEVERGIRSEAALLQSLNHPNIVRGYEFFEVRGGDRTQPACAYTHLHIHIHTHIHITPPHTHIHIHTPTHNYLSVSVYLSIYLSLSL
jgi:serine/threonine protein kinase